MPTRGDSTVPMVYVVGWHRLGPDSPDYPSQWKYAPRDEEWGFTLQAGDFVEVRAGGSCTIDGVTHRSTLLRHDFCHGRS